jgi:hypothetical protein
MVAAGVALFSATFGVALFFGLVLVWRPIGRGILAVLRAFLSALWRETMRNPCSTPSRWACRVSGYVLPVWPGLANRLYHRPELLLAIVAVGVLALAGAATWGIVALLA